MTRKEFSSRYDEHMRAGRRQSPLVVLSVLAFVAVFGFIPGYLRDRMGFHVADSIIGVILLVVLVGLVVCLVFLSLSQIKKFGLVCPHCGRNLTDVEGHRKVLLTGDCPKCKKKVFDEDSNLKSHGLDRDDFRAKFERLTREGNRKSIGLLIFMFATMIASIPMARYFMRLVDSGGLDWVTWTQWKWIAVLTLATVFLLSVFLVLCATGGKISPCRPLPCPECGRSLAGIGGRAALDKGICVFCGCRLFGENSAAEASVD